MSDNDDETTEIDNEFQKKVEEFEFESAEKRIARELIPVLDDSSLSETHDLDDVEIQHAEILLANFFPKAYFLYFRQTAILVALVGLVDYFVGVPAQAYGLIVAMYASFLLAIISTEGRYRIAAGTVVEDGRLPMLRVLKAQASIETTVAATILLLGFGLQLVAILFFP